MIVRYGQSGVTKMVKLRNHKGWYLYSIIVWDEEERSKGVGSIMLHRALRKAKKPIYTMACEELGGDINRLYKFYGKFGFEKIDYNGGIEYNYNMILR